MEDRGKGRERERERVSESDGVCVREREGLDERKGGRGWKEEGR